ncbi:Bug family tripartite tricarboxylate transporter substrate binding protein [Cupriavidus consociatus]|uniref:Bug family tripartite tricarboxylate transporter substrate binding protein n=1 Tax=Cupriavidus consociatus TaxID=2821357 RepID=UPI001AEA288B|nr:MULTISPECIES: tripartite tricarboxylate transporter substrate-binding protein [unclassified Cupriavidus]MBP0623123.1 hypothetical protein [Cupriavidus sp. LEh25]MDK2659817.1 tripartite tricarboxylate transporter substrate-binding protein [Cupriavidus sp. LEh21]
MNKVYRIQVFIGILLATCFSFAAAAYPERPIRMIVPYPAGGIADNVARRLAQEMGASLKQTIIIENKPGADGIIAVNSLKSSSADGYTILMVSEALTSLNGLVYKKISYDTFKDMVPIGKIGNVAIVLSISPSLPVDDVSGLVSYAKKNPGKLNYASLGKGSISHLAAEMLKAEAGIDVVHVPYAGGSAIQLAKMKGDIQYSFGVLGSDMEYIKNGRLKALAVASARRSSLAPAIPTLAESGFPDFDLSSTIGLVARTGTPQAAIDRLNASLSLVLKDRNFVNRLSGLGFEAAPPASPQIYWDEVTKQYSVWEKFVKRFGFKIE